MSHPAARAALLSRTQRGSTNNFGGPSLEQVEGRRCTHHLPARRKEKIKIPAIRFGAGINWSEPMDWGWALVTL